MVGIVKPKATMPATDAQILKFARKRIEQERDRFICNAIANVGVTIGKPAQIATLVGKVREAIHPYAYYTQWARASDPGLVNTGSWQRRGRLELIDRLIQEADL